MVVWARSWLLNGMRSHIPLPSQKRKYKLAGPSALVCPLLDVVGLLSEAQPPE